MGYAGLTCVALCVVALAAFRPTPARADHDNITDEELFGAPAADALELPVPQQLLALTGRRTAADGIKTLSLCAARDDSTGAACRQALAVWLSEERRLSAADGGLSALLWRGAGGAAPVLGIARWKWVVVGATVCCYATWSYLVWLVLGVVVLAVRLLAVAIQGVLLGLALTVYGAAAIARQAASVYSNLSQHTRRQQIEELDAQLAWHARCQTGTPYEEWRKIAERRDELSGAAAWRKDDHGWEAVRKQEETLGRQSTATGLMFALQPLMKRPAHAEPAVAMGGARHVSERQSQVLLGALKRVVDAPEREIRLERKLQFFSASQLALGHTALCLSGGGSLAMHHMGVVRALLEMRMLPRVISGTSGGAIVAGFLAQRTDAELLREVCVDTISTCLPERWFPPLHEQVANFISHGVLVKSADFEACAKAYFGNVTFEEGYYRTGRHVNISIASSTRGGQGGASVLLNHVTTPNVLIYSAVAASCSLPGIMRAATLMAKDATGRIVPMDPPGTKYVDGSLRADLPLHRLSQLFHVSQFIVSQVNPHIAPFLETPSHSILSHAGHASGLAASLAGLQRFMFREVQHRCRALAALNMLPTFFGEDAAGVFRQRYHGCLTIVPRLDIRDCLYGALCNPSVSDMQRYINEGRLRTWESLQGIRLLLDVELALEAHREAVQAELDARVHDSPRAGASEPSRSCLDLAAMDRSSSGEGAQDPAVVSPPSMQRLGEIAQPMARLPKASSWAHGLSEISTSRQCAVPWQRIDECHYEQGARSSWHPKIYASPPPLPALSLHTASVPALRHVVQTLCKALWEPRGGGKRTASIRRYSQYS